MRIVAWVYDADVHCLECAMKRFGENIERLNPLPYDREGNHISPVFETDEIELSACGTCNDEIA